MVTFSFPFRIENGAIVVDNNAFSPLFEINHLLQMYLVNYGERFYNLQQSGMLKTFLFENMTEAKKQEIKNVIMRVAEEQTELVYIRDVNIYSKQELKTNRIPNIDLNNLEQYSDSTYFINIIFTTRLTNITTNMVMSEFGDVFTGLQAY